MPENEENNEPQRFDPGSRKAPLNTMPVTEERPQQRSPQPQQSGLYLSNIQTALAIIGIVGGFIFNYGKSEAEKAELRKEINLLAKDYEKLEVRMDNTEAKETAFKEQLNNRLNEIKVLLIEYKYQNKQREEELK